MVSAAIDNTLEVNDHAVHAAYGFSSHVLMTEVTGCFRSTRQLGIRDVME